MVSQTRLECLSRLSVPPQFHAAFRYEVHTSRTPRVRWQVDEPVGRMWLIGLQERGGIQMARVVVSGVENKVSFGIEERRLCEIGVETVPYERGVAST